jgi:hypothetical protein
MENRMAILRNVDLQAFGPINYDNWMSMVANRVSAAVFPFVVVRACVCFFFVLCVCVCFFSFWFVG